MHSTPLPRWMHTLSGHCRFPSTPRHCTRCRSQRRCLPMTGRGLPSQGSGKTPDEERTTRHWFFFYKKNLAKCRKKYRCKKNIYT